MDAHPEAAAHIPTAQETRELIESLWAQVSKAQVLREIASDLRQSNAELRELLLEARLMALARYEQCREQRAKQTTGARTATQNV